MISYYALGEIEDGSHGWRAALRSGLSDVYVPGEGDNPQAFIIGEAPGAQEQAQKRPFVGPAGILLRRLMLLAGLSTEEEKADGWDAPPTAPANCWLTNTVHFRPPRNRTPTSTEIECARPWLMKEWVAVGAPRLVVPVGGTALTAIMGKRMSILRLAGEHIIKKSAHNGQTIHVWPMVHPSFALRPENEHVRPLLEQHWLEMGNWLAAQSRTH